MSTPPTSTTNTSIKNLSPSSALTSTTSALTSTLSFITSNVLPLATTAAGITAPDQQQLSTSQKTTISTHTSAHSEIASSEVGSYVDSISSELAGSKTGESRKDVNNLAEDMFSKVAEYLKAELLATTDDYKLLENMNYVTRDRYKEMSGMAQNLMVEMSKLQTIYTDFEPYVQQIDEICEQVEHLDKVANELDDYSKELEMRLKKLVK